jgi:hypothetical protein
MQRILSLAVGITTNEVIENEALINSWMDVFDTVIGKVAFEYTSMVAVSPILDMIDRKNSIPKRKKGNKLLMSLARNCGEEAFDEEDQILRKIVAICGDTNYEIRLDGVMFLRDYLSLNAEKLKEGNRLENVYLPELYELLNDEESMVRIEAIEASIEVLTTMGVENVEKQFMPPLLKMLNLKATTEDVVPRMSKLIGKITHKLMQLDLHQKHKEPILNYF